MMSFLAALETIDMKAHFSTSEVKGSAIMQIQSMPKQVSPI